MSKPKTFYNLAKNNDWKKQAVKLELEGPIHFIERNQRSKEEMERVLIEILAANRLGIPFVFIDFNSTPEHIKYIKRICRKIDLHKDTCAIFFTSGSTGKPKPIQWTNRMLINLIKSRIKDLCLSKNIVIANFLPLNFRWGFCCFIKACCLDAEFVYIDKSQGYENIVHQLIKNKVNYLAATSRHWDFISNVLKKKDLKLDLTASFAGSKIKEDTLNILLERTKRVIGQYGCTEAIGTYHDFSLERKKPNCVGKAQSGNIVRVICANKKECKPFKEGEIVISGNFVSLSCSNPFKTGDIGYKDKDGDLFIIGRKDEQLKIKGYRVNCSQLEEAYNKYNVCVFKAPVFEPGWDEAIAVFETNESLRKIKQYVDKTLPPVSFYCRPRFIFITKKFPLTLTGKIDKVKIKNDFYPKVNKTRRVIQIKKGDILFNDIEKELLKIWQRVLKRKKIGINDDFFEIGSNSILFAQIYSIIKQKYTCEIFIADFFKYNTISKLANFIERKIKKHSKTKEKTDVNKISGGAPFTKIQDWFLKNQIQQINKKIFIVKNKTLDLSIAKEVIKKMDKFYPALKITILDNHSIRFARSSFLIDNKRFTDILKNFQHLYNLKLSSKSIGYTPIANYPNYYNCAHASVMEKIRLKTNKFFYNSLLPALDLCCLPTYLVVNNKIKRNNFSNAELLGYKNPLDLLNIKHQNLEFKSKKEALNYYKENIKNDNILLLTGPLYYLLFTSHYKRNSVIASQIKSKIPLSLMFNLRHTCIFFGSIESNPVVYSANFNYFGRIPKNDFMKYWEGSRTIKSVKEFFKHKRLPAFQALDIKNIDKVNSHTIDMLYHALLLNIKNFYKNRIIKGEDSDNFKEIYFGRQVIQAYKEDILDNLNRKKTSSPDIIILDLIKRLDNSYFFLRDLLIDICLVNKDFSSDLDKVNLIINKWNLIYGKLLNKATENNINYQSQLSILPSSSLYKYKFLSEDIKKKLIGELDEISDLQDKIFDSMYAKLKKLKIKPLN